jgi:hypothetical protein
MNDLLSQLGSAQMKWRGERQRKYVQILNRHAGATGEDGDELHQILRDLGMDAGEVTRDVQYLRQRDRVDAEAKQAQTAFEVASREAAEADRQYEEKKKTDPASIGGFNKFEAMMRDSAGQLGEATEKRDQANAALNRARTIARRVASEMPPHLEQWAQH